MFKLPSNPEGALAFHPAHSVTVERLIPTRLGLSLHQVRLDPAAGSAGKARMGAAQATPTAGGYRLVTTLADAAPAGGALGQRNVRLCGSP